MPGQRKSEAGQKDRRRGRSERSGEAYFGSYVEPLSEARTKLTVLFTSREGGK
jgi:hypothetical protein